MDGLRERKVKQSWRLLVAIIKFSDTFLSVTLVSDDSDLDLN